MKVGIPKALLYYQYYPAWRTFFEELGAEVVVSPPTNGEMFTTGCSRMTEDICLPVKIFCGHAFSLANRCDYLFIPSIHSVERKIYNCPKFIGLPDLTKASIPECPPIIDPDIDVNKRERNLRQAIYQVGRLFARRSSEIDRAAAKALRAHQAYQTEMCSRHLTPLQVIKELFPQEEEMGDSGGDDFIPLLTVALIGHPYLLYDEYANHRLVTRLRRMGAKVMFPEVVGRAELRASMSEVVDSQYWTYEEEVIGAGAHYLRSEVDGVISVAAFGCGPDSLMVELLQRYSRHLGKPFLSLVLDQHTSETGLITRLEAFVDMISRGEKRPVPQVHISYFRHDVELRAIRALGIPNIANLAAAFKAPARKLGVSLIVPPVTQRTLSLGSRHSPESACLPFKVILGSFIEELELGADTLYMATSFNACRMGYYARVQEQILHDLGYDFQMLKFKSSKKGLLGVLQAIRQLSNNAPWLAIISAYRVGTAKLRALDDLVREVQRIRAVEMEKGQADRIFKEAATAIEEVASLSPLKQVMRDAFKKLNQISKDPEAKPLRVALVGEMYAVMEPFSNMNIEAMLGKLGVEVSRTRSTFFSEWTKLGSYLNALNNEKKKLQRFAQPYLKRDVGGHGLESLAEKVRCSRDHDGVVHLAPFTCMPEAIAQNIMSTTKEDIPVLTILCDEQMAESALLTRVEAFVDLLRWRRRKMGR